MKMYFKENLLILTKTYPLPSKSYREHTCVAAINENGELRRLYPIPFRLLKEDKQFKKWQWIEARILKAPSDKRPESYRIDVDSISIKTTSRISWEERMHWIRKHIFNNLGELEEKRINENRSFGFIKPIDYTLEIEEFKEKEWTKQEIENLNKNSLFDTDFIKNRPTLKKLPYKFYYSYVCIEKNKEVNYRHRITDWEVGMLYLNCFQRYKEKWEIKMRGKIENEFKRKKDLYLLMGNMHRFQHQWLIVGLVYPPKNKTMQELLFSPRLSD